MLEQMDQIDPSEVVAKRLRKLHALVKSGTPLTVIASPDSGLSYSWLTKFYQGQIVNPTVQKLGALDRRIQEVTVARCAAG